MVLDEATGKWGIKVNRVEIRGIEPPATIRDAMEQAMRADRGKRAAILTAEGSQQSAVLSAQGEKQAAVLRAEAAKEARILDAEAEREAALLRADGEAQAIARVVAGHQGGRGRRAGARLPAACSCCRAWPRAPRTRCGSCRATSRARWPARRAAVQPGEAAPRAPYRRRPAPDRCEDERAWSKQQEFVLRTLEERDIRFVRLWFTDVLGTLKSVAIAPAELEGAFAEGLGFDGSAIEGFTRVQESDMLAQPDPTTFQVLPWRSEERATARMFCDITMPDGTPSWADPRHVLRRALSKAADAGLHLLHPPRDRVLPAQGAAARRARAPEPVDSGGYFDLTPHGVSQDFRREAITMLERMGISVEFSHHEVAPGQQEIDLRYADALSTADNILTTRHVIKEVALSQGVYATFMPKPFSDQPGSGMHTHLSLFEGDTNAFFDAADPLHLSKVARHFIAGLLHARRRDHRRHQPVGQLLQAAGVAAARPRPTSAGAATTAARWCGCRCTSRPRAARPASRSAAPTAPPTPTCASRCCSPPGSRASRRSTRCRPAPRTTSGR